MKISTEIANERIGTQHSSHKLLRSLYVHHLTNGGSLVYDAFVYRTNLFGSLMLC